MGQACTTPAVRGEEFAQDPHKKLVHGELKRSKAESLLEIPGADVIISDANGEEAHVASGTFRFVKMAPPSKLCVVFVGESFEDLNAQGFYYPLLIETPVCLTSCKATKDAPAWDILTMHAGEGDVFGVRLPDLSAEGEADGDKRQALIELFTEHCAFEIATEPDFADKIVGQIMMGGRTLISGVEWATEQLSVQINKGGEFARSKVGKAEEEVQVSHTAQAAVTGAKFVSGSTVAIATTVTDGLMDAAVIIGEEVKKATQTEDDKANPKPDGHIMKVGKAAGMAGLQVYASLMKAGDRLVDEATHETAQTVGHRYGQDASEVAREGLGIAKDIKDVSNMVGKKAVKRLATRGAMYTAKGLMDNQLVKQSSSASLLNRTNNLVSSPSGLAASSSKQA